MIHAPIALIAAVAVVASQDGGMIEQGPMAGMWRGPAIVRASETTILSLLPSRPNASRPDAARAAAVAKLLAAEEAGDMGEAEDVIADNASMTFCSAQSIEACRPPVPFAGFDIPGEATANTPYAINDNVVRLEWISEGRVAYVSFLQFSEGKLAGVRTGPAVISAADAAQHSERTNGG